MGHQLDGWRGTGCGRRSPRNIRNIRKQHKQYNQRNQLHGTLRRAVAAMLVATVGGVGLAALSASPAHADPGAPVGEEFSGSSLDTGVWSVVDPLGDSTVSVTGGALSIAVPGGTPHDMWTSGLDAPRVVQQVADADAEVEAKFDAPVNAQYQLQGLVAEGASGRLLRFDTYSDGSAQHLFAAAFVDTSPTVHLQAAIPATAPIRLRMGREGDTWTLRWSADGTSWNVAATFAFEMELTALGVFAGNAMTPAPAHTARVDYFRPVTADVTPPVISGVSAQAGTDTATVTWATDEPASSGVEFGRTAGYGESAGTSALATSHEVTLTGLSCETEYHFRPVSADAAGNTAFGADGMFTTGTCPPPDTVAPTIDNVDAQSTASGAVVTWTTDEPATSRVDYGPAASYGQAAETAGTTTAHSVTISGLACESTYHYRPVSADATANTAFGTDATFTTAACASAGVVGDEFTGPALDTAVWSLADPVGDAAAGIEDGRLRLHVPAGVSHDFWVPVQAPRLLQDAPDDDISVQAKFDSPVDAQYQMQGLVAEDGAGRLIRFDTYANGSEQNLFAAAFVDGTPTTHLHAPIPATTPIHLGLERAGDTWTARWSADGTTWNIAATFTFAMTMSKIGLFAGNAGPSPEMTAYVDYFRVAGQGAALTVAGVQAVPAADSVVVTWTTNRPADSRVDYGPSAGYGQAAQDPAMVTSHSIAVTGLACATTYHFRVTSTDAGGAAASSPDGTFTTTECQAPPGIASDDFSGAALDTGRWTALDPLGDAQVAVTGTNVALFVPSGTTHDMWTGEKTGARLIQEAPDADFEIEVKFDSPLGLNRQSHGILVQQDANTFLRFDELSNGSSRILFAAVVTGGSAAVHLFTEVPTGDTMFLRARREGSGWTLRYSRDGQAWQTAATFGHALAVTGVGFHVGNGLGPAAVASVDYFSNLANPVANDDGGAPPATSPPTDIDAWYGDTQNAGARHFTQQWVDVLGRASDPNGIGQLWYRLNGSAPQLLDRGPNGSRLAAAGDFVAELDRAHLVAGANTVELAAFDRLGHLTSHPVVVNNLAGPAPALPDSVGWAGAASINDVAHVVDGLWEIQGATVRTLEPGYDRLIAVGSTEWPDGYEVTVPATVHSATSGGVGVLVGWTGHTGNIQPRTGHPYGALGWFRDNRLELVDAGAVTVTSTPRMLTPGVDYTYKLRAEPQGNGTSVYRFKVWETGTPEPGTWDLTTTLPSRAGSAVLVANGTDASFGTVQTTPLAP